MTEKVVPIRGRYETMHSMVAHVMGDDKARSGMVIYFDDEGGVNVAEMGLTAQDMGMILLEVLQKAQTFQ